MSDQRDSEKIKYRMLYNHHLNKNKTLNNTLPCSSHWPSSKSPKPNFSFEKKGSQINMLKELK